MFAALVPALLYPALWIAYRQRLAQKRLELRSIMSMEGNVELYRKAFGSDPGLLFVKSFGVVAYAVPVAVNALCVWILVVIVGVRHGLGVWPGAATQAFIMSLPRAVVAALMGAFVWGMYDALRRYRAGSLSPESLHFTWLRMLIGGSVAPFIAVLFSNSNVNDFIAFGIGSFPAKTLSDFIQNQVASKLQMTAAAVPSEGPTLQELQGSTTVLLETLSEADIDSTQDLAYSDPLKLFLRTNIPWATVLDFVDQALLFNYVGDKLKALRVLGVRGSIEFAALHDAFQGTSASSGNVKVVIARIAELLGESVDSVLNLIDTCYFDYQVKLVGALWGDAFASDGSEREAVSKTAISGGPTQPAVPDPANVSPPAVQTPTSVAPASSQETAPT